MKAVSNTWSVYKNNHLTDVGGKQQWVEEIIFYAGDLSSVDTTTDWRFKAVEGKRDELKFLGVCETTFPIKYPLHLDNGTVVTNPANN